MVQDLESNYLHLAPPLLYRGRVQIIKAETLNLSFRNPVSLTLLRMVQDIRLATWVSSSPRMLSFWKMRHREQRHRIKFYTFVEAR